MKIGIIGAMDVEVNPLIGRIEVMGRTHRSCLNFVEGRYNEIDVVVVSSGPCKVNATIATQILIDKFEVSHVIMCGVAGAIDSSLKMFDTVIATESVYHDVDDTILKNYHPKMDSIYFSSDETMLEAFKSISDNSIYFGVIVSGEAFIEEDGRDEIIANFNPLCVDMETTAVSHSCFVNNIPFVAIRSMSDTPSESGVDVFRKNCAEAALKSVDVLCKYLDSFSK